MLAYFGRFARATGVIGLQSYRVLPRQIKDVAHEFLSHSARFPSEGDRVTVEGAWDAPAHAVRHTDGRELCAIQLLGTRGRFRSAATRRRSKTPPHARSRERPFRACDGAGPGREPLPVRFAGRYAGARSGIAASTAGRAWTEPGRRPGCICLAGHGLAGPAMGGGRPV